MLEAAIHDDLRDKLQTVISLLSTTARPPKLFSINAALVAGRSMSGSLADGAEFRTVAEEIHRLSERSESGLAKLTACPLNTAEINQGML